MLLQTIYLHKHERTTLYKKAKYSHVKLHLAKITEFSIIISTKTKTTRRENLT
jgi:hypothetical protein